MMNRTPLNLLACAACFLLVAAVGCSPTKPMYLNDTGNLSYYLDRATDVEYPDIDVMSLNEVTQACEPITVLDPDFTNFYDVSLEDVVSMALKNTKVIRGYGTPSLVSRRVNPGQDNLTINPNAAATMYNIAIRESEAGFISQPGAIASPSSIVTNTGLDGNQGVEAALAEFDAQYTGSFDLSTSDQPRNGSSILNNDVFTQTQFTWQQEIAKKSANGTQLFFRNINQYTANNNPLVTDPPPANGIQILDSFYRASLEAEIRQPLLRGRGAFINRMPIVISRISTDQEIANLESTLQNMVTNLEIRYWDLYFAYRNFAAAKAGHEAALKTWRIVKNQYDEGAGGNIQTVSQAGGQVVLFNRQVNDAYDDLLNAEGALRFLLGWASTDSRFLRPIDEPVTAPVEFDWCTTMCEALTYRPEVRQQRWEIKKRELGLQYAKNGLLPEFNVSLLYRWLGLGNKYGVSGNSQPFPDVNSGALNDLYGGDFQELTFNGSFGMPVGFRREHANVRNAELKLARAIAVSEDLELDINKELTEAFRALAAQQYNMLLAFKEWSLAYEEVEHFFRLEEAGAESLDIALDAQRRRAQAEIAFHNAVVEYNKVIALIHRRKGTILAYSGIEFAEGPWPGKAYVDAGEHARRRSASRQINYGWTRPQVISRGPEFVPADNTGNVAPAQAKPVNPAVMNEGQWITEPYVQPQMSPMGGAVESMEYYENEVPAGQPILASPITDDATSQYGPADMGNIQQVGYEQPVNETTDSREAFQPVAIRTADLNSSGRINRQRQTIHPQQPERDQTAAPARRLRAHTPGSSFDQPVEKPVSEQSVLPIPRTDSEVSWERLGLDKPEPVAGRTTARIRQN